MRQKLYKDTIHGFEALAISKQGAWMMIRNKCKQLGFIPPTIDKIIEAS